MDKIKPFGALWHHDSHNGLCY